MSFDPSCPVPFSNYERITLAHGGGGRVMQRLIRELFVSEFDSPALTEGHDGARLAITGPIAMTTDAFTVSPIVFPGGDIGSLAVHGTVNDLAMCGARPRHLAVSFVLEEGLALSTLARVVRSMAEAARASGVSIVTGDTKVVERGKGDSVFVTTTGIGEIVSETPILPAAVRPGDAVIVSGPVGDHGTAVMLAREGLPIPEGLVSDSASVADAVLDLLARGVRVRCLRDATRGGLATVLAEIASASGLTIRASETAIPVSAEVADACELLGLDPLYVACEGRFVAFVHEDDARLALEVLAAHPVCRGASLAGAVEEGSGQVILTSPFGSARVLDLLSGEQLPRIC